MPPRVGRKFGRLVVLEVGEISPRKDGKHKYLCRCDCGNTALVRWESLARGKTKSCGCLLAEHMAAMQALKKPRPGQRRARVVDGVPQYQHPLWNTWRGIIRRCEDPSDDSYRFYGARGVTVCEAWHEFPAFVMDMGPRPTPDHTVDRVDPTGPYSPENCRWADPITQYSHMRNTPPPILVTLRGKTSMLATLARRHKVDIEKVRRDIRAGQRPEVAFVAAVVRKRLHAAGRRRPEDYAGAYAAAEKWLETR